MLRVVALPIEIFKAGKHTAMSGETIDFSEAHLKQIASAYDPKVHEAPVVLGHPSHDAPAYGWAKSLALAGGVLSASLDQVDAQFAENVKAGKWKKVSASFYKPDSANNPTPGQYYLRHIGFLGAMPPAVKGLRQASFAGSDEDCLDFADLDAAALFRSLRDWMIAEFGQEKADKALPPWDVNYVQQDAAIQASKETPEYAEGDPEAVSAAVTEALTAGAAELGTAVAGALAPALVAALTAAFPDLDADKLKTTVDAALAPGEGEGAKSVVETALTEGIGKLTESIKAAVAKAMPAAPAAATTDLGEGTPKTARERELERENAELRKRERQVRRDVHASFLDGLAKEGRRLPARRAFVLDLLEFVDGATVSFAEGDVKATPFSLTKALLSRLPKEVDFSERGGGDEEFGDDADPAAIAKAAQAYQTEQAAKGNNVTTSEAVNHVRGRS
jgi:hypothetical protein